MSRFGSEVDRDLADIFTEAGDLADYQGSEASAAGIWVVLERDWEVFDDNQVAMRVTTISVLVSDVATSRQGDTIALPGRTWTAQQVLEDDGHIRRLWVS